MNAEELLDILRSIEIPDCPIAFSGGLDSSILAEITGVPLYSIGLPESYDMQNSRKVSEHLGKMLYPIEVSEEEVVAAIPKVSKIVGTRQLDIEIGVPFYLLFQKIPKVSGLITGQGADELFGGYKRYEKLVGTDELEVELRKDAEEVNSILKRRELKIAKNFGIELYFPYLSQEVFEFAKKLPVEEKVSFVGRKLILKEVAKLLGLPEEIYNQPKKAIQYGTGISKVIKKNVK